MFGKVRDIKVVSKNNKKEFFQNYSEKPAKSENK